MAGGADGTDSGPPGGTPTGAGDTVDAPSDADSGRHPPVELDESPELLPRHDGRRATGAATGVHDDDRATTAATPTPLRSVAQVATDTRQAVKNGGENDGGDSADGAPASRNDAQPPGAVGGGSQVRTSMQKRLSRTTAQPHGCTADPIPEALERLNSGVTTVVKGVLVPTSGTEKLGREEEQELEVKHQRHDLVDPVDETVVLMPGQNAPHSVTLDKSQAGKRKCKFVVGFASAIVVMGGILLFVIAANNSKDFDAQSPLGVSQGAAEPELETEPGDRDRATYSWARQ